jgi:MoaA/NifB/PqqE/SkfB family radical SAM enzyme
MIRIVNWLLTRRCNLNCDYCAIVKEPMSLVYPPMHHYHLNEMSTQDVIEGLERFKQHNPNAFHIFYGGEPLLRKDLHRIINFCNNEDIHYTIISNNTKEIQPLIKKLLKNVREIRGFTASVDPAFVGKHPSYDRIRKSEEGFNSLVELKKYIKDVVAEITVTPETENNLHDIVALLTRNGISSDITFVDIAKSPYYDFSNVTAPKELVEQSSALRNTIQQLIDSDLDIHMKEVLLPEIWKILPSEMDCQINRSLHNVSVDADGTIRLCLRIRGIFTPDMVTLKNLFMKDGQINPIAHGAIKRDKIDLCKKCNHTCQLMSKIIDDSNIGPGSLVHLDRRTGAEEKKDG